MPPALSRVAPAVALCVPLLVAGATAAAAATGPEGAAPVAAVVAAGEDHDDADMDMSGHDDADMDMSGHDDGAVSGDEPMGMSGHDDGGSAEHGTTVSDGTRPRTAVLSSFAGVNAAVLGGTAFLRRRDRRHAHPGRSARRDPAAAAAQPTVAPTDPTS